MIAAAFSEADARDPHHQRTWVVLVDGAEHQGAEAVLTLRAVIANGDFDQYWRYHLTREHQRLYPGTEQGQYTLSA